MMFAFLGTTNNKIILESYTKFKIIVSTAEFWSTVIIFRIAVSRDIHLFYFLHFFPRNKNLTGTVLSIFIKN